MDFDTPPIEPISLMQSWLDLAEAAEYPNPFAMTLATVDPDGNPSARVVLLKALDEQGVVFYTNYLSRKSRAIEKHPKVALVFHWDFLTRQIVIEGTVTIISEEESDAYFASRPRASQIGAWASEQSEPVADRATLDASFTKYEEQYDGITIPRPPHWGGYRVSLDRVEFWLGRPFRLHDRMVYTPDGNSGWKIQRLYP